MTTDPLTLSSTHFSRSLSELSWQRRPDLVIAKIVLACIDHFHIKKLEINLLYHVSLPKGNIKEVVVSLIPEETGSSCEWNDTSPFHLRTVHIPELDMSVIWMWKISTFLLMRA